MISILGPSAHVSTCTDAKECVEDGVDGLETLDEEDEGEEKHMVIAGVDFED